MMDHLETRLRETGIACRVEQRDRLLILVPDEAVNGFGREARLRALQVAREEGCTHVAVELDPGGATLPRA
jgi:hypothetical protein